MVVLEVPNLVKDMMRCVV